MKKYQNVNQKEFYYDAIHCLVRALDYRDAYTRGHSTRVGDMAYALAGLMQLEEELKEYVHIAGHLHDIGKIGIPDTILNKRGMLNDEEWSIMKTHPEMGADIARECDQLQHVAMIILQHHERWDGHGYPNGLKRDEICLEARIIALCDTIDAMSSNRSYRTRYSWKEIRKEIRINMGRQFDPNLEVYVDALIDLWIDTYETNQETKQVS